MPWLHVAIQSVFGWSDTHLHEFRPWGYRDGGSRFGIPMDEFDDGAPVLPGWEHRVADVLTPANPRLEYEYDFGGPGGYECLLETMANPEHPDHASSHAWAASQKGRRGKFDPEAFDEQQVKFANPAPRLKRLLAHLGSQR